MGRVIDLKGKRFGKLTVIEKHSQDKWGGWNWLCRCDCGNETVVSGGHLRVMKTKSCGCSRKESKNFSHKMTGSRIYSIWQAMKNRCYYEKSKAFKHYGGRGIKVCDEWKNSFISFYEWSMKNGYDENAERGQCTIDRIDVNGNYEPNNCRWATIKQQANNTRRNHFIEYNGKTQTVSQWANELGVEPDSIFNRLQKGFTEEEALTLKFNERRKRC